MLARLGLAALLALSLAPSIAHAQGNGAETVQCQMVRVMQWLSIAVAAGGGADYDALSLRERVACGGGVEAADPEYWPNGVTLHTGGNWYYPSGVAAISGGATYYPNGVTAGNNGVWYYPNGVTMQSGAQLYLPNGAASSEAGLVEFALSRLPRERADELLGYRMRTTDPFWRTVFLIVLVSEASRA